eukprot:GHVL01039344.1.p1 GENE.GHVL01039344.1~~GHVL01039344.1.p1  ORF type:complete len:615 (+),score=12.78 GHVL01039344.1:33-1877(+)
MMLYLTLLLAFTPGVLCSSHRHTRQEPVSETLTKLEQEFWEWRMLDAPMFSTSVGESRHNDIVESFAPDAYTQRKVQVADYLSRVSAIDRTALDQTQRLDLDIFKSFLQTFLDGAQWNSYFTVNPVNFLEGDTADPTRMATIMPFSTIGDFDNYLQRLLKLPGKIDQEIQLLEIAVSTGRTLNNVSVAGVPDQIDSLLQKSTHVDNNPFYQPAFTTRLDSSQVPLAKRASLRARADKAVYAINEAMLRLKAYLQKSYFPATRTSWGVSGWADGKAIYETCLKFHTTTDMTPQQVHDLGLKEVARIQGNMNAALKRLQFSGTIKEFYDKIRTDARFHVNTSEEVLGIFNDYIFNRIFPKLSTMFKDIPNLPLKVEPMPFDGPGGQYASGTPDGSVPGIFYANVMHPKQKAMISAMSLSLHETVPGHHLQSIYSLTSTIPKYRAFVEDDHYYRMPATFPINTAYLEGWALYSEYLGEELGMYTDDYMLMGRYSDEIFRACRLVVDTGLHYFGWNRDRAIQYMLDNTAESRQGLTVEVDRYLTWPGQATAYKIGEIKIKELRQRATDQLGTHFQLADFHSVILQNGGMPLNLLERLVDDWIAKVKAMTHPGSDPLVG